MSFRKRLFLFFALAVISIVGVSTLVVGIRFGNFIDDQVGQDISSAPEQFNNFLLSKMNSLIVETANISSDPKLRGTISTGDRATIIEAVTGLAFLYNKDLFWLLDKDGRVVYRVDNPGAWGDTLAGRAVVTDAINGFDSGDFWVLDDDLYIISAVPIKSGSILLGSLIIGMRFDEYIEEDFSKLTNLKLEFRTSEPGKATFVNLDSQSIQFIRIFVEQHQNKPGFEDCLRNIPQNKTETIKEDHEKCRVEFTHIDEQFIGVFFKLNDISNQFLSAGLVYRSMKPTLMLRSRIQNALLGIGAIAFLFALGLAFILSQRLTGPINRLINSASKLGEGDLESTINSEAKDEIGTLANALNDMRISLYHAREEVIRNERLSTVGQMASTITHDFRQPISAIYGFVQLLNLPNLEDDKREKYSSQVMVQIDRMVGMIDELLDFSKGVIKLNITEIEVTRFLEGTLVNFEVERERRKIEIVKDFNWDGTFAIDQARLSRCIDNLIRNSLEAIDKNGKVTVSTEKNGKYGTIRISDDGPGIPLKVADTLFEPFVSSGKEKGTGLGLAVVHKVIEEHGGEISVENNEGRGASFNISLPIKKERSLV